MNQTQAITKLRKVIGKTFGYRVDKSAPTAEERAAMRVVFDEAKRVADEAEAARVARFNEVLRSDALYQELKAKAKAASAAKEKADSGLYRRRITVGSVGSIFFTVRAEGDNWTEVVEKVCGGDGGKS